jgi:hypothetical protein
MRPTISCRLTQARKAGLSHDARRAAWARAAGRGQNSASSPGPGCTP